MLGIFGEKHYLENIYFPIISKNSTCQFVNKEEKNLCINTLELKAAKLAIMNFSRLIARKVVHIQMDNTAALIYLLKMRGMNSSEMNQITQEIWQCLIRRVIMITTEYLPTFQNVQVDWESRHV